MIISLILQCRKTKITGFIKFRTMIIKGFIKEVGQTRDWTDKNGESRQSVKLTLTMPYDEYENKSYYSFEGQCESGYEGQQGGKLYGVFENGEHFYDVSYANTDPYTYTTYFDFVDYGSNGGKLYYTDSYNYYLKFEKSGNGYRAYANPDKNSGSNITLFKRVKLTFVKWKRVQNPADLATGDTTVIVDLTSSNAMKNNPADDESPAAMSVTLKEELDRLTSGVGDTITWTVDRSDAKYQFYRISHSVPKVFLPQYVSSCCQFFHICCQGKSCFI